MTHNKTITIQWNVAKMWMSFSSFIEMPKCHTCIIMIVGVDFPFRIPTKYIHKQKLNNLY